MHTEIEKIRKELSVHYGLQELMQEQDSGCLTRSLWVKLHGANIKLDRKSLAGVAFSDPETFKKIVEKVRV